MPRFSANLGYLWPEHDIPARVRAARHAGFNAVEFHFPYHVDASELAAVLQECDMQALAVNALPGNLEQGDFGLAAVPGRESEARVAIEQAVEYAGAIRAARVHVMAGLAGDGDAALETYRNNLEYACTCAAAHQLGIVIEPINRIDRPGYTLHRIDQAEALIRQLRDTGKCDNLGLMFDCYHVQKTEGNLVGNLELAMPCISHIQIAAVPDRAEPDHGEVDYPWLMQWLDRSGYDGFVGAEYIPAGLTDAGLDWYRQYC